MIFFIRICLAKYWCYEKIFLACVVRAGNTQYDMNIVFLEKGLFQAGGITLK